MTPDGDARVDYSTFCYVTFTLTRYKAASHFDSRVGLKMKFNSVRLLGAAVLSFACLTSSAVADTTTDEVDETLHVITWGAAGANEDGTPLTNLAGYYLYVGTSPETLVPAFYTTSLQQSTMWWYPKGTARYFAVTAVNWDGVESQMSAIVMQ